MALKVRPLHNLDMDTIACGVHKASGRRQSIHGIHKSRGTDMKDVFLNLYIKFQILMDREDGQDMVEYALLVALIALASVAGTRALAGSINTAYVTLSSKFAALLG